ncbi:hypothetical protein C4L39_25730 [Clostridium diolis]|nr:hypothetical protein C4L39_25730 [Clostridium diolis]
MQQAAKEPRQPTPEPPAPGRRPWADEKRGKGRPGRTPQRPEQAAAPRREPPAAFKTDRRYPPMPKRLAPVSGPHSAPQDRAEQKATAGHRPDARKEPAPTRGLHRQQGERIGTDRPGARARDRRSGPHNASTGARETIQGRGSNGREARGAAHAPGEIADQERPWQKIDAERSRAGRNRIEKPPDRHRRSSRDRIERRSRAE